MPDGFYVSARKSDHSTARFLLGPYDTHEEALDNVDRASAHCIDAFPVDGPWALYGTCRATVRSGRELPNGILNSIIGLTENPSVRMH